jgi:hypothetical protein
VTISGYLGSGTAFDQAIARFAGSYAGQVTRDYDALVAGIWSGRIPAVREPVQAAQASGPAHPGDRRDLAGPPGPGGRPLGKLTGISPTRTLDRFGGRPMQIVWHPVLTPVAGKGVNCNHRVISEQRSPAP